MTYDNDVFKLFMHCFLYHSVVIVIYFPLDLLSLSVPQDGKAEADDAKIKPLKWEEDMQLYSRFLDRKVISNSLSDLRVKGRH